MIAHGPDAVTFEKATFGGGGIPEPLNLPPLPPQPPVYFGDGLAFMFESNYLLKVAPTALQPLSPLCQEHYALHSWAALPKLFTGEREVIKRER